MISKKSTLCALGLALTVLAIPAVVFAQDNTARAREHYKTAQEDYKAGRYRNAVVQLKKAYAIKPHPTVLRQMGHCYKALGDIDNALENYQLYVEMAPGAPDLAEIQETIRELEEAQKDQPQAAPAPVVAPIPVPARASVPTPRTSGSEEENPLEGALRERTRRTDNDEDEDEDDDDGENSAPSSGPWGWLKWTAVGVGVAALPVAFVFRSKASTAAAKYEGLACTDEEILQAKQGNKDLVAQCTYNQEAFFAQEDIQKFNTLFGVTFGVGMGALAASGLFFYLDHRGSTVETSVEAEEASLRWVPTLYPVGMAGEVRF